MSDAHYRILMVCTGNICRSPVMERLLIARLAQRLPPPDAARFDIASAGTWAMPAHPIQPIAARTLVERGGDPSGFISRDIEADELARADLILTADRDHRSKVVTVQPAIVARTLTLRELARLLGPVTRDEIDARVCTADPVERFAAIVAAAFANRGLVPPHDPADDDIADPYGRDEAAYQRSAATIDAALAVPLALL